MSHTPPRPKVNTGNAPGQPPNAGRPGPTPQGMAAMPDRLETATETVLQEEGSSNLWKAFILFFKNLSSSPKT